VNWVVKHGKPGRKREQVGKDDLGQSGGLGQQGSWDDWMNVMVMMN
jgi:hypothetical protein